MKITTTLDYKLHWTASKVRTVCVHNDFYTCGDNDEYDKMLTYVSNHESPDEDDLLVIASDILRHSDEAAHHHFTTASLVEALINGACTIVVNRQ